MDDAEREIQAQIQLALLKKVQADQAEAELRQATAACICRQAQLAYEQQQQGFVEQIQQSQTMNRVQRQLGRPSQFLDTWVFFDDDRKQWTCVYSGVAAFGDSPEMACDNFDHLWMYGK